jgi:drug/metabolite transporter (DMT)-like permease
VWCLGSAVLFGASTPASKILLGRLGPMTLAGVLYAGAALAVAPWALSSWPRPAQGGGKDVGRLVGAVVFGGIVGPVLLLEGLAVASAATVSLWLTLETVATAILARWLFREHLTTATWLAVALVTLASVLVTPAGPGGGAAIALVALACFAWGLDNNLTAVIDRFTPAQITFAKGLVAGAVNLGLGGWLEPRTAGLSSLAAGLAVGALGYGASLLLYVAGAQQLGATRSQMIFATAPLWGFGVAWVALSEPLGPVHVVSAGLMAGAIWLWHRERHDHRHVHEAVTHRHWHRHDDGHHDHAHDGSAAGTGWHIHEHHHPRAEHSHSHRPDLHHRHAHPDAAARRSAR